MRINNLFVILFLIVDYCKVDNVGLDIEEYYVLVKKGCYLFCIFK